MIPSVMSDRAACEAGVVLSPRKHRILFRAELLDCRFADAAGKSDPFVELFTTKDDMRTTRVINNSLTPEWNEVRSLKRCDSALAKLTLFVDLRVQQHSGCTRPWLCVCCIQYAGRWVQMLASNSIACWRSTPLHIFLQTSSQYMFTRIVLLFLNACCVMFDRRSSTCLCWRRTLCCGWRCLTTTRST
jgi:hypothetical protein